MYTPDPDRQAQRHRSQAWLADRPQTRLAELLPWNWAANHLPKSRLTAAFAANGSIAVIHLGPAPARRQ